MRQPARPQADAGGYFAPPTLVTGDLEGAEIWREEVFGPVLCAMPLESDEDAIALANASRFGLAHAVFSADEARAAKCADALDAGVVWGNANQILWPDTPFGGWCAATSDGWLRRILRGMGHGGCFAGTSDGWFRRILRRMGHGGCFAATSDGWFRRI